MVSCAVLIAFAAEENGAESERYVLRLEVRGDLAGCLWAILETADRLDGS